MKSNWENPENYDRYIRPPYSKTETLLLQWYIEDGLSELKDTGKVVNYEEMCAKIINSIPRNYFIPEFKKLIEEWQSRFKKHNSKKRRIDIFNSFIIDIWLKWLLKKVTITLTGYFSQRVWWLLEIVEKIKECEIEDLKNPVN